MENHEIRNEANAEVKKQTETTQADQDAEQERKMRTEEYLRRAFGVEGNDRVIICVY